jgi:hypothetical protein
MGKERDANGGIRRAASPCADERHDDLYFNANMERDLHNQSHATPAPFPTS